jgi:hypothetical protein
LLVYLLVFCTQVASVIIGINHSLGTCTLKKTENSELIHKAAFS